jgi:hypothetical protein
MLKSIVLVIAAASLVACAAPADESDAESATGAQTAAPAAGPCTYEGRAGISLRDDGHTSRGTKYTDNDTVAHANELAASDDNENPFDWHEVQGISSKADTDWFRYHVTDARSDTHTTLKPEARITAGSSNFRVCVFTPRSAQCEVGTKAKHEGMNGCCATNGGGVRLDIETPFVNDTTDIFIRVEALTETCENYRLEYKSASND